ncbi:hypothetical protein WMF37_51180 [Sorangium sp. So ce291]
MQRAAGATVGAAEARAEGDGATGAGGADGAALHEEASAAMAVRATVTG